MQTSRIPSLNTTLQKTDEWLEQIQAELAVRDEHVAYQALRAVLHTLRDRLTVEQAAALGAELPMLVRGLYFEGWKPSRVPIKDKMPREFFDRVATAYAGPQRATPQALTTAVLRVLERNCAPGLIDKTAAAMPGSLQAIWPLPDEVGLSRRTE
jgi:uncharacterized protein (DUF2267 family)